LILDIAGSTYHHLHQLRTSRRLQSKAHTFESALETRAYNNSALVDTGYPLWPNSGVKALPLHLSIQQSRFVQTVAMFAARNITDARSAVCTTSSQDMRKVRIEAAPLRNSKSSAPMRLSTHSARKVKAMRVKRTTVASLQTDVSNTNTTTNLEISQDLFGNGKEVEKWAMKKSIETAGGPKRVLDLTVEDHVLSEAYERCGKVTGEYAKTFYLGTKLMTPDKQAAIWAVYVWCRRTDELVDGPNASRITPEALRRWDERLEALFAGKPYDVLDAALSDSIAKFSLDIQPFRDMVDGMRMDLVKSRYETFDELYEYCYRVAGTVGLMSVPVMGIDPANKMNEEKIYGAALALGLANQLTNILRDVGEDAGRGRIYVPTEDLERFNITEAEVMKGLVDEDGNVDPRWKEFMKFQIERARFYFAEAEAGVTQLDKDARWPVWSALILYRQILDAIEANGYNNFTQRAFVPKWKKFLTLPVAYANAMRPPAQM